MTGIVKVKTINIMKKNKYFIRDESFVIGLMNSIDQKIESCFKVLNELNSDRIKSYGCDDSAMKVSSVYTSDNEILNCIMKLEKLRNDYFVELQDLKPKE